MPPFSQRHAPPPRAFGDEIPVGVRRSIASWFGERHISSEHVRVRWFQQFGHGDLDDVIADVEDRWGRERATTLRRTLYADPAVAQYQTSDRRRIGARRVLYRHVPTPFYLDFLEVALLMYAETFDDIYSDRVIPPIVVAARHVNDVFETRGIVYRFNEHGLAQWHGDEGAYSEVLRPALDALADPRLEAAGREYGDALVALRHGDRVGVKNAIRDASNAIETTMKALLDACGIQRPEHESADNLWDALRDGNVVAERTKEEICGPSHLRNRYGGHGPDPANDEPVPEGVAPLAAMTAGAAIVYLASLLPS